jgi:hypothetical protein
MRTDKVTQLVLKLIKLTKSNEIKWNATSISETVLSSGEIILDKIYLATAGAGNFKVYRYKYKFWVDEDRFEWTPQIRLLLIDKYGETEFEFEYENSMNDLYDIVREQASNVSTIVDDLLGLNLEILEATYYTPNKSIDVTPLFREKISNNKLIIVANNELAGDPEHGITKKLKVIYSYAGETLEKEVNEYETIKLP